MSDEQDRDLEIRREQVLHAVTRIWDIDPGNRAPMLGLPSAAASAAWPAREGTLPNREGSAAELGRRYRCGELSPVEAMRQTLARAEDVQPKLNAFIRLLPERALAAAKASEERFRHGQPLGPLDGVPVAAKDIIDVAGVPTTAASKVLLDNIAGEDAPVVRRLEAGGAIVFAKTNLHEFAYGGTGDVSQFGPCRNPRNPEHMTGGSSSGSGAAVGAGVCSIALGTDTGGSVRIPAAACGIVGLKPTYGRVSTAGVIPLSWSLDHIGPMTATVEDAALALSGMCDFDMPPLPVSIDSLKLGICREHFFSRLDAEVRRIVEAALARLGELHEVSIPHITIGAAAQTVITAAEAANFHKRWLETRPGDYNMGIRNRLQAASQVSGVDYVQALRIRGLLLEEMEAALAGVDVLAMPALPIPAPRLFSTDVQVEEGSLNVIAAMIRNTAPINFTGFPAISIPCGQTAAGLPVGLQLVAGAGQDGRLLQIAQACEAILSR